MGHAEQQFHVKDVLREKGAKPGTGIVVDLRPAQWLASVRQRLCGAEHRLRAASKRYFTKT